MKKYVLQIGNRNFVFQTTKQATAAYEILEMAQFVGQSSWRRGNSLDECPADLNIRTYDEQDINLMSRKEAEQADAVDEYKRRLKEVNVADDTDSVASATKRLEKAKVKLAELGIDPATIPNEEDE